MPLSDKIFKKVLDKWRHNVYTKRVLQRETLMDD